MGCQVALVLAIPGVCHACGPERTDALSAVELVALLPPVEEYERLLEDLHDLASIAERREEPSVSHEDLVAELKRDGLLPT
jgi:hypothetical protein